MCANFWIIILDVNKSYLLKKCPIHLKRKNINAIFTKNLIAKLNRTITK